MVPLWLVVVSVQVTVVLVSGLADEVAGSHAALARSLAAKAAIDIANATAYRGLK